MPRPVDCSVGSGGMWGSNLLWMLWFFGPECQCWWDEVEELVEKYLDDDCILTRMKAEDITPSRARNLLYKLLIRAFCGPLGKGIRKELPDCCLKWVWSLEKKRTPKKCYIVGFKPSSKLSKSRDKFSFLFSFISIEFLLLSTYLCLFKNFHKWGHGICSKWFLCHKSFFLYFDFSLYFNTQQQQKQQYAALQRWSTCFWNWNCWTWRSKYYWGWKSEVVFLENTIPSPQNNHINNRTRISTKLESSNQSSIIAEVAAWRYVLQKLCQYIVFVR